MRWIFCLLFISAYLAAAEPAAIEPSGDETATLIRLNQHRDSRVNGDLLIADVVRLEQIPVSATYWNLNSATTGHAPPLVFNRTLITVARSLLKQANKPVEKQRYDASAALRAAGYAPEQGSLVMFAYDAPSLPLAYAMAMTNSISEVVQYLTVMRPVYSSTEAVKPEYREAGVAVYTANGKTSLVIVLGTGAAKRYVGGIAYIDGNHDNCYAPGEGKAGVLVKSGAASITTGPSGAWWLALDTTDEADIAFSGDSFATSRRATKADANEAFAWRLPNQSDMKKADKLIADVEKDAATKDAERKRVLLANLLTGTRLGILDDERQKKIIALVAPIREDFNDALQLVRSSLVEDPVEFKKRVGDLKKKWKGAMPSWFKEAESLALTRQQVVAFLIAPVDQRVKFSAPLLKLLAKCLADSEDPAFVDQYLVWQDQIELALAEARPKAVK